MHPLLATFDTFQKNVKRTLETLKRPPSSLRLLLVSKGVSVDDMALLAQERGHLWFAENRLEELEHKAKLLHKYPIKWAFVGPLQSHKIPSLVSLGCEIQTAASYKHLGRIYDQASKQGKRIRVLLQANIAQEWHKSGASSDDICKIVHAWRLLPEKKAVVDVCGIMAIPPQKDSLSAQSEDGPIIPDSFHQLRTLQHSLHLPELSLGMSQDWQAALHAGTTTIRIGRAIFHPAQLL